MLIPFYTRANQSIQTMHMISSLWRDASSDMIKEFGRLQWWSATGTLRIYLAQVMTVSIFQVLQPYIYIRIRCKMRLTQHCVPL